MPGLQKHLLTLVRVMKVVGVKDFEAVSPLFRGETGNRLARFLMHLVAIDKVNLVYDHSGAYRGAGFASRLLQDVGVHYLVGHAGRLRNLPEGAFITISNHPYGGLDGIILVDLLAGLRSDFKLMVNQVLALVETMKENFITVSPAGNKKGAITAASIAGIRETLEWLQNGHPVGFFPSGAVSDLQLPSFRIRDRKWQRSVINLIKTANVPVLPLRFFDGNSPLFYFLGLINWRIRLMRMPHEVFNKRDRPVRLAVGEIIPPEELARFDHPEKAAAFLRRSVYEMPLPPHWTPRSLLNLKSGPGMAPAAGSGNISHHGS